MRLRAPLLHTCLTANGLCVPASVTALALGARLVQAWGGTESMGAAAQALQRIEGVLPPDLRERLDSILMYAPGGFQMRPHLRERLDLLHEACITRRVIAFAYTREDGEQSQRDVRPLALYFWSGVWTLASWCELRQDFRVFRMDRIDELRVLNREFTPKRGQRLEDFLRTVEMSRPPTAECAEKNG